MTRTILTLPYFTLSCSCLLIASLCMHSSSMPSAARSCCRAATFSMRAAFSTSFWDKACSQKIGKYRRHEADRNFHGQGVDLASCTRMLAGHVTFDGHTLWRQKFLFSWYHFLTLLATLKCTNILKFMNYQKPVMYHLTHLLLLTLSLQEALVEVLLQPGQLLLHLLQLLLAVHTQLLILSTQLLLSQLPLNCQLRTLLLLSATKCTHSLLVHR